MISKQEGIILATTMIVLATLMLLGAYFLVFALNEIQISSSNKHSVKAYYLAEAGINEAVWKLKNDHTVSDGDPAFADDLVTQTSGSGSFSRSFEGGEYAVTATYTGLGQADVESMAKIMNFTKVAAQRVVKTKIFKALGSVTQISPIFSGGSSQNIDINYSILNIYNGNIFSNNNLNVSSSQVYVDMQVLAGNNILENSSEITSQAQCAKNICTLQCDNYNIDSCPPAEALMPAVDFDSSQPTSFKSRALATQSVFTSQEFNNLLSQSGGTLTLNNQVTYVTGDVIVESQNLIVNGVLVADGNIYIGDKKHPGILFSGGSLLSKRKIYLSQYISPGYDIEGVIYSLDELKIFIAPLSAQSSIRGGVIARKVHIETNFSPFVIDYNNDIILNGLGYVIDGQPVFGNATFSPVITIDHWEESY